MRRPESKMMVRRFRQLNCLGIAGRSVSDSDDDSFDDQEVEILVTVGQPQEQRFTKIVRRRNADLLGLRWVDRYTTGKNRICQHSECAALKAR